MIPSWKIKREVTRVLNQVLSIPEVIWGPFANRAHNAAFDAGFPIVQGQIAQGPKIALVLCYQPKGLPPSFFGMLDHLVSAGYAPFVVSNATVSVADMGQLTPRIWRAMQRPNFGYDFGGYRDGLFLLRKWSILPERLVILNDSIWFPAFENDTTLHRAEAAPFDIVGLIMQQRRDFAFLESYFFSFGRSVLQNPHFWQYWDNLKLTSNKFKVIRRGERGFSRAMQAAGVTIGPLFSDAAFQAAIMLASAEDLRMALRYASADGTRFSDKTAQLAAQAAPNWPDAARAFFTHALGQTAFSQIFQVAAAKLLGFSIVKKSDGAYGLQFWRAAWLRAHDDGYLSGAVPQVLAEMREKVGTE